MRVALFTPTCISRCLPWTLAQALPTVSERALYVLVCSSEAQPQQILHRQQYVVATLSPVVRAFVDWLKDVSSPGMLLMKIHWPFKQPLDRDGLGIRRGAQACLSQRPSQASRPNS